MNEMREAAFAYRSLHLHCYRSGELAVTLMWRAKEDGDMPRAHALAAEVMTLADESEKWRDKWMSAGGQHLAPIAHALPLHPGRIGQPGVTDMENVVFFPTNERAQHAS
jgi:hypothetical protein